MRLALIAVSANNLTGIRAVALSVTFLKRDES